MKLKIRINELARELEVKPNKILELLPELGVQEKKTHSSSIDEDVAIAIKQRLIASGRGSDDDYADYEDSGEGVSEAEAPVERPAPQAAVEPAVVAEQPAAKPAEPAAKPAEPTSPENKDGGEPRLTLAG